MLVLLTAGITCSLGSNTDSNWKLAGNTKINSYDNHWTDVISLPEFYSWKHKSKMIGDCCCFFKCPRRCVDEKHFMRFQNKTSVFKLLRRSVDRVSNTTSTTSLEFDQTYLMGIFPALFILQHSSLFTTTILEQKRFSWGTSRALIPLSLWAPMVRYCFPRIPAPAESPTDTDPAGTEVQCPRDWSGVTLFSCPRPWERYTHLAWLVESSTLPRFY